MDPELSTGEDTAVLESTAPPEVREKALDMGWIPPERYKGDPDKFVDAEDFVRRGEEVLPIVKARARKLEGQVGELTGKVTHLESLIKANAEAMEALEQYHTAETQRKVAQVRKDLKSELARASEAGDHEAVAEATDQLVQLNAKVEEAEAAPKPRKPELPAEQPLSPEFKEWAEDTGWFGKDRRKTAVAMAVAQELRAAGETATGRDFLDLVAAETNKTFNGGAAARPSSDKVGSGRPGAGQRISGGKTYNDLPPEAKAACDSYAKQLVGEGRRHKTLADWRAKYTQQYFEEV